MLGNDFNVGGFASHISPGRFICILPDDLGNFGLHQLSIVADAVTTPYQSLMRSNLKKGDLAIVIETGDIRIYMVQLVTNAGATVIALDIGDKNLKLLKNQGAKFVINSKELDARGIKAQIKTFVKKITCPSSNGKYLKPVEQNPDKILLFLFFYLQGQLVL